MTNLNTVTVGTEATFKTAVSRLSLDPNARGQDWERLALRIIASTRDFPDFKRLERWHNWAGRTDSDHGIDIVGETGDGRLWAFQCKANAGHNVDYAEIAKFHAAATAIGAARLVLLMTHYKMTRRAAAKADQLGIRVVGPEQFDQMGIDWGDLQGAGRLMPRHYQTAAAAAISRELRNNARATMLMACGTGKTATLLWVAERDAAGDATIAVMLPSLTLIEQTYSVWKQQATLPFHTMAVCSDVDLKDDDAVEDISVASLKAIVDVSTDPDEVAAFLATPGRKVLLSTYQSADVLSAALLHHGYRLDLLVADEAHRTAGAIRNGSRWQLALHDTYVPATKRVFATATPRINKIGHDRLEEAFSMDDPAVYGQVAFRYAFGQARTDGYLSDYFVEVALSDSKVDGYLTVLQGVPHRAEQVAHAIALLRAMQKYGMRSVITYHARRQGAKAFNRILARLTQHPEFARPEGWRLHYLDGTSKPYERDLAREQLRDPTAPTIVSNCKVFSEGVDVPALDAVLIADKMKSVVDIVQIVGRAMRTAPGKERGAIILPAMLTDSDDVDQALRASDFSRIYKVVRALADHDDLLAETIKALRLGDPATRVAAQQMLDDRLRVGDYLLERNRLLDLDLLTRHISTKTVQVTSMASSIYDRIPEVEVWYVANDRHPREKREGAGTAENALAALVNWLRQSHVSGEMPAWAVQRLEAIAGWAWRKVAYDAASRDAAFQATLAEVVEFRRTTGKDPYEKSKDPHERRLGVWVMTLRRGWKKYNGEPVFTGTLTLTPERIAWVVAAFGQEFLEGSLRQDKQQASTNAVYATTKPVRHRVNYVLKPRLKAAGITFKSIGSGSSLDKWQACLEEAEALCRKHGIPTD